MLIDCDDCAVRGPACGGCVVTALLDIEGPVEVGDEERQALGVLADGGLVPALRLVAHHPASRRAG